MKNRKEITIEYINNIKKASKETAKKELFKGLLERLFHGVSEIESILDKISIGAETSIVNIPRKNKIGRGSADTLYNKIIIEFENDLSKTLNHAKEQLAGYLIGKFKNKEGYDFTLIATDCIKWKVYAPDIDDIDKLEHLKEHELRLNEDKSASFDLTEKNADEFYFWLDRFLFKAEKQNATLEKIEQSFGYTSKVFIESYRLLSNWFQTAKISGEVQVSYEQWDKFLNIAYGSFKGTEKNFLIHTYLSVFSKMLAYAVVSNDDYIDDKEMKGILDGQIFNSFNIVNFVDNDFFHWVNSDINFQNLKNVFRLIAQEISIYDFHVVEEDILKGVYQELIELETRHNLGEYYTPDWLCERIVQEYNFKTGDKILDPSCGSGSFLRAAIHRFRELNPEISIDKLANAIHGIDIHPLSVQIAKTTVLLALGKEIKNSKKPFHINIIQANTLLAPDGVTDLFGENFEMEIDSKKLLLNSNVFHDIELFNDALDACEMLAEQTLNGRNESLDNFIVILEKRCRYKGIPLTIAESFYKIYDGFKSVKENGRDSIWKFIVQNLYKPRFLAGTFTHIIGNPPWITYGNIANESYKNKLNELATKYLIKPNHTKNLPNLDIAAIFMAYCSSYFLQKDGKITFVLPRSFLYSDNHDNTRSGKAKGFRLISIWDLQNVAPLFRIPSCVLFGEKKSTAKSTAKKLNGISFTGKLSTHNNNYDSVKSKLTEKLVYWYYNKQGANSSFGNLKGSSKINKTPNPYKNLFKRGAEMTPRGFYFVELAQEMPSDWEDRVITIKTSENIKTDAKKPWIGIELQGRIESQFLFRTALAKSILPFALFKPDMVVLPITITGNKSNGKRMEIHSVSQLRTLGYLDAAKWFNDVETIWNNNKTEKNKIISATQYLNWHNKLLSQDINKDYLVIYNASAKDANATIIIRERYDLPFFVDTKAYVFYTNSSNEAYYLAAILNSAILNEMMKDFQSKGLFGARDVHKKILDIYFPIFDKTIEDHIQLANIGKKAHEIVAKYLVENAPQKELSASHLGRLRTAIKKNLVSEIKDIDKLVKKIIKG